MSRLLSICGVLALLCLGALAAEWQILYPNVMTIAIGVSAPDESTVYVSGANDGTGAAILKSADAGQTWNSLPHDPQMLYLDIEVAKGTTFGISPGIAMLGLVSGSSYTEDGEVFQATPDTPLFSACQSSAATNDQTFYMVGFYQRSIIDGQHNGVIASFDGGQSLKYYDWGIPTSARYGAFPSNTTWFISGGMWADDATAPANHLGARTQLSPRFAIERTVTGAQVEINLEPKAMGANEGYHGVIARTTDGGRTFQTVYNDTGRFYFNAIDCPDVNNCWAVAEGPEGAWIIHSADGGNSWDEQFFAPDAGLFDVKFLNSKEGWAVGGSLTAVTFNALFLRTTDGGQTWTNTNSIDNAYPNSITLVNSERAYATAFLRNGLSSILIYN